MAVFTVHQAKSDLSKLIARAEAGEEIVVARRDKPAVRLVPVEARDKGEVGFADKDQAKYDLAQFRETVPAGERPRRVRGFGMLAHLPPVPDDFFSEPLTEEELRAWEGGGSADFHKPPP